MLSAPMNNPIDWTAVARALLGTGLPNDPQVAELAARLRHQHDVPGVTVEFGDGVVNICHAAPPAGLESGWERIMA